jgi:FkbM family methyltransferase
MPSRSDLRVDQLGAANRWGKRLAPLLSAPLALPMVARGAALLESYLAVLQGKGAGSGWDLRSEAVGAAQVVRTAQPLIVDVGANKGGWALALDALIAPLHPRYLLVEPSSHCQEALQTLPLRRVNVVRAALGDHEGEVELQSERPGSETASLYARRDSFCLGDDGSATWSAPLHEVVPLRTLDGIAAEQALAQISLLKLDVEGCELDVLRGARRLLDARVIDAIAFEFGASQINSRIYFHDLWDLLHPLEYTFYRIRPGGGLLPVGAYYEDLEYFRGVSNYLAVARSVDPQAR